MKTLIWVARNGDLELVYSLVEDGADIHQRDEDGWTALMKAAVSGHLAVMRFLVALGAEGHARNNSGETALTWLSRVSTSRMAKRKSGYEEMVDFRLAIQEKMSTSGCCSHDDRQQGAKDVRKPLR